MTHTETVAQARKVVEATTTHLCHQALHITTHYKTKSLFACIQKMTDEEWTLWTRQPVFIKPVYLRLAEKGDGWKDIVELAFDASQRIQAKMILEQA